MFHQDSEISVLSNFLKFGRKNLLSHPLAEIFLQLKWSVSSIFFYLNVLLYFVFLSSLTCLCLWTSNTKYKQGREVPFPQYTMWCNFQNTTNEINVTNLEECFVWTSAVWFLLYSLCLCTLFMFLGRELIQMRTYKLQYFKSKENILELVLIFSSWTYLTMVIFGPREWEQLPAALALFLGWVEMYLMLGRHPSIGMFTYMMLQIMRTVLGLFSIFITILLAFTLFFHSLLILDNGDGEASAFYALWPSLLKVLMMIIGEYDYGGSFTYDTIRSSSVITDQDNFFSSYIFPVIIQVMVVGMVFTGTLILSNLITGLTLYNIDRFYHDGYIFQLGETIKQIESAETIVISSRIFQWAKNMLPKRFFQTSLFNKLTHGYKICVKPNENITFDESLTKLTRNEAFEVFTYCEESKQAGKSLQMFIPSLIVKDTFEELTRKEVVQSDLQDTLIGSDGQNMAARRSTTSYSSEPM